MGWGHYERFEITIQGSAPTDRTDNCVYILFLFLKFAFKMLFIYLFIYYIRGAWIHYEVYVSGLIWRIYLNRTEFKNHKWICWYS
jgi:hypothetical protein